MFSLVCFLPQRFLGSGWCVLFQPCVFWLLCGSAFQVTTHDAFSVE